MFLEGARFRDANNEKRWETVAGGVMSRDHGRWGAGKAARTGRYSSGIGNRSVCRLTSSAKDIGQAGHRAGQREREELTGCCRRTTTIEESGQRKRAREAAGSAGAKAAASMGPPLPFIARLTNGRRALRPRGEAPP